MANTNLFVCVTCQSGEKRPGAELHRALQVRGVSAHAVECMSVCTRPCTIAVSAPNKWSYIVAGLSTEHIDDICQYLTAYTASEHGTPPLKERPASIRSGTIARLHPR